MRSLLILVVGVTLFMATLSAPASASGFGPCSQDRFDVKPRMGIEKVQHKVMALIRCVEERWPAGGSSRAIQIADCESSLWPWANNGGNYLGLYQHSASAWVGRVHNYLRPRWFNDQQWDRLRTVPSGAFLARANVIISLRIAHSAGWSGMWWSCA